ncbi:DUF4159 domain-containing protein [candidate division KSB1 bacterium]
MKKLLISVLVVVLFFSLEGVWEALKASDYGFRFIRIRYTNLDRGTTSYSRRGRGRGRSRDLKWDHDWDTAEKNLYKALEFTTEIKVEEPPLVLDLKDKRIFEYPVLYFSEPGYWYPDETDITNLREYFNRGGFALFDDFRDSNREWDNFYFQIKRVFPEKQVVQLPDDHPVWNIFYEIDPAEAPSLVSGMGGGKYIDSYWAMFDDDGRMMLLACRNQDIGDGWEWPNRNLNQGSTVSFQMGINFIIYALTH